MKKQAKAKQDQAAMLRAARRVLGCTNAELGAQLGKSEAGILAWLAPKGAAKHRTMPAGARMLLERIVKEQRAKK